MIFGSIIRMIFVVRNIWSSGKKFRTAEHMNSSPILL